MKKHILTLRILILALSVSGCSRVEFVPVVDENGILENPELHGQARLEVFTQAAGAQRKIDVLVVDDNSQSMAEEQQRMGQRIQNFLGFLSDVDWQLGITTTDVTDGVFGQRGELLDLEGASGQVLNPNVANYNTVFQETITREESGNCGTSCASGIEEPLRATIMAIEKRNAENAGLFRDDADLAVIYLTDEDEMSDGNRPGVTTPSQVLSAFQGAWGSSKRLSAYALIVEPGDLVCLGAQNPTGNEGNLIASLVRMTGGVTGSICDTDYSDTLSQIGEMARRLLNFVELKETPAPETIKVGFEPAHNTNVWAEGRRVYFEAPPAPGTRISVQYETAK